MKIAEPNLEDSMTEQSRIRYQIALIKLKDSLKQENLSIEDGLVQL